MAEYEGLSVDVKKKVLEAIYVSAAFILARFPYASAILLMLSTGESLKTSLSVDRNKLTMSYGHIGMFFFAATAMSFNLFGTKRFFALLTVAQYAVISVEDYLDKSKKETLLVRQISRNVAIMGCYLMVAGGLSDFERGTQRHKRLLLTGMQLLGVYSFIYAVIIWNSPTEFKVHSSHLPGGTITTFIFIALFLVVGICLYGGYEIFYFSKVLAWLLFVVTIFVDLDTKMWWNVAHIPRWLTMTVASKHLCIIITLLLVRGNIK